MIDNVSNTTQQSATTPAAQPASPSSATTPFGAVLSNQLTTPNIYALFNGSIMVPSTAPATPAAQTTGANAAAATETTADPTPTAESVFGPAAWLSNPGGNGPFSSSWQYNPIYFATQATAEKVASMVGGTVVEESAILGPGPMVQNQPNEMVKLSSGQVINPGLVASFYTHGYPQSYIDRLLQSEVQGA